MQNAKTFIAAALVVGAVGFASFSTPSASITSYPVVAPEGGNWKLDPVHSTVLFKINHAGASNFWGRFNDVQGTVAYDPAAPEKSTIDLTVKADSVDTNNEKRDTHVKGPDFFSVKEFPTLNFKSKSVKKAGNDLEVAGDLTFHGVTKPLTVKVSVVGVSKSAMMGERAGFDATFTVKRSDFGVTQYVKEKALGDDVTIVVALEGVKA